MVPWRSRNTAARKGEDSGTLGLHHREPWFHGSFDHRGCDDAHAAMVRRAMAEKTWTAIRFLLNDRAARRHGGCAVRIGGTKHGHDGQTYASRHVHRSRIVTDKNMASRKQGREIGNRGFLRKIDGRPLQLGNDCSRDRRLRGGSEKYDLRVILRLYPVGEFGES